jgi:hypothetical protein
MHFILRMSKSSLITQSFCHLGDPSHLAAFKDRFSLKSVDIRLKKGGPDQLRSAWIHQFKIRLGKHID